MIEDTLPVRQAFQPALYRLPLNRLTLKQPLKPIHRMKLAFDFRVELGRFEFNQRRSAWKG